MEKESPYTEKTLRELVLLALGTPEIGAVNFNILQTLLLSMLDQLHLLDSKPSIPVFLTPADELLFPVPPSLAASNTSTIKSSSLGQLDKKVSEIQNRPTKKSSSLEHLDKKVSEIENQLTALTSLPTNSDIIQNTKFGVASSTVADIWQHMQLQKKVENNEDGVTRALSLVDDVLKEFKDFRDVQKEQEEQLAVLRDLIDNVKMGNDVSKFESRLNDLEEHSRSKQMEAELSELAVKLAEYPDSREFETYVTWPVLEEALTQNMKQMEELRQVQDAMAEPYLQYDSDVVPASQPSPKCDSSGQQWKNDSYALQPKNDSKFPPFEIASSVRPLSNCYNNAPLKNDSNFLPKNDLISALARQQSSALNVLNDMPSKVNWNASSPRQLSPKNHLNELPLKDDLKEYLPRQQTMKNDSSELSLNNGSEEELILKHLSPVNDLPELPLNDYLLSSKKPCPRQRSAKSCSSLPLPIDDSCELPSNENDSTRLSLKESEKGLLPKRSSASTRLSSAKERFPQATDLLARIGELNEKHVILEENVHTIQDILLTKADKSDLEGLALSEGHSAPPADISEDLLEQVECIKETIEKLEKDAGRTNDKVKMQQDSIDNILTLKGGSSIFSDGESSGYESASGASASNLKKLKLSCQRLAQKMNTTAKELTEADETLQSKIEEGRHSLVGIASRLDEFEKKTTELVELNQDLRESLQELQQQVKNRKRSSVEISEPHAESQFTLQFETCEPKFLPRVTQQDPRPMLRPKNVKQLVGSQESAELSGIQAWLHNLEVEMEKLARLIDSALEEHKVKQKHIDTLYVYTEKLKEKKADKKKVNMEIDLKAEKLMLHTKVNRSDFDSTTSEITKSLDDLLEKILGQDANWQKALRKLSADVDGKMDRLELERLKQHLENRMKAMKKLIEKHQPQDIYAEGDEAAGFRKQLLQNYNCISCDRPVEIAAPGAFPSIPASGGLPTTKSVRPYTSYELDQIRHQSKGHFLVGRNTTNFRAALEEREIARLRKLDELCYKIHYPHGDPRYERRQETEDMEFTVQSGRSCGGGYTLTYPLRRYTHLTHLSELWQDEEEATVPKEEVELQGHDGHIYKGRLPVLQRPQQTQNTPDSGFSTAREKKEVSSPPNSVQSPARPNSVGRTSASSERPVTVGRSTSQATVGTQDVQKSMEQFTSFTTTSN